MALVTVTAPKRVVLPTAPVNRTLPAVPAFSINRSALGAAVVASTVFWKVMLLPAGLPPAVVSMLTRPPAPPLSVTARRKFTAFAVVVMLRGAVIVTAPAPFCVTAPSTVMSPLMVNSPAFVKVTVPPLVVVMLAPATVWMLPVRLMPLAALVLTAPVSRVVP